MFISYNGHCQTAPLYRPEKPAQFGAAHIGGGLAHLERISEFAAHALNMAQNIMFVAQNFFHIHVLKRTEKIFTALLFT